MPSLSEALKKYSAIVITGGSSGIGKSFIELGAKLQPELLICNLSRRIPDISSAKLKLRHISCDLSQRGSIEKAADVLLSILTQEAPDGRVLLINNSGFGSCGPFLETKLAVQLQMIDVNVCGLVEVTGRLLPTLCTRGGGIINVASAAAFQPTPLMTTYGATKAFVLSWGLALREELRGTKVRVLTVCPGPTATQFGRVAGLQGGEVPSSLGQTPEEVARISLQAFVRDRGLVVTGWKNRLASQVAQHLPRVAAARLAKKVIGAVVQKRPSGGKS